MSIYSLFRVMEHGLLSRHRKRLYPQKPDCGSNTKMFASASLRDTFPAYQILLFGLGGAVCVCLAEIMYVKWMSIRNGSNPNWMQLHLNNIHFWKRSNI